MDGVTKVRRILTGVGITALAALAGGAALTLWQPRWLVALLARRSPDVLYFVETTEPRVALTIDDGPDAGTTPRLLDLLAEHEARATFFLISDRVLGQERLAERIAAAGHEIGNHLTRDRPSRSLSPPAFESALLEADSVLSRYGKLRWMRPGSGWFDEDMLAIMERHGYRCALGSIYPYDATIPSPGFAARHILRKARPGSIIVLHDGGARGERALETLARVLPELRGRGLRVVTLSELAATEPAADVAGEPPRP